jgi:succinate dehydrogenase/fumarate reductase flavoprotein subunit
MGAEVGARLGNMSEVFWFPTFTNPGDAWEDGSPVHRPANSRQLPGAIVVNQHVERFADETTNKTTSANFHAFDPHKYT